MGALLSKSAKKCESDTTEERTTKIFDLNDDCLMEIFKHLDIQNLFNVAIANVSLRPAAAEVYKSKFGGIKVQLRHCSLFNNSDALLLQKCNTSINIFGLKTCLQYLRCFGSTIKNLQINYNNSWNTSYHRSVHRYIDIYCVDSLEEIEFLRMHYTSDVYFVKPFTNVRSITFEYYIFENKLRQLMKWFPNLRYLKLNVTCLEGFTAHLQHLEHLCIDGINFSSQYSGPQNAAKFLNSNRQLRSLKMHSFWAGSISTVLDMIEDHSLITKLHIKFGFNGETTVDPLEIKRIASEHSLLVELSLYDFKFTADDVIALIDQLKSLEVFEFYIDGDSNITRLESNLNQNEWVLTKRYDWHPNYLRLNRKNPMSKCLRMRSNE